MRPDVIIVGASVGKVSALVPPKRSERAADVGGLGPAGSATLRGHWAITTQRVGLLATRGVRAFRHVRGALGREEEPVSVRVPRERAAKARAAGAA